MAATYVTVAQLRSVLGVGTLYSDADLESACQTAQDLLNQYVAQKDLLIRENTATRDILETKIQNLEADMEKQLQRALDNPLANR